MTPPIIIMDDPMCSGLPEVVLGMGMFTIVFTIDLLSEMTRRKNMLIHGQLQLESFPAVWCHIYFLLHAYNG